MSDGLHLISCYLPNDPFVDGFFADLASELTRIGHRFLLLPTYEPGTDAVEYVQVPYELEGYTELIRARGGVPAGLLPDALRDLEVGWTRRTLDVADAEDAVAACAAFFGRMLDEMEPDSVSVWNPAVPQGRILQMASLARGIPFFGIERGVFAETIMLESREVGAQADLVSSHPLRSLVRAGLSSPGRFDEIRNYYLQRDFSRYPMKPVRSGEAFRRDIGLPDGSRLVVLMLSGAVGHWVPRSMPAARFNSRWFESAQEAVDAVLDVLPDDTWLVVQDHPIDFGHWSPREHPKLRHVRRVHLRTLFDAADVLAFLGATTVQHEALLSGKPILLLSRSQLSGYELAYEYAGSGLDVLVESALRHVRRREHLAGAERYVPFLFDHMLFGPTNSPVRYGPADMARHLASLEAAHSRDANFRIQRWLMRAADDAVLEHEIVS